MTDTALAQFKRPSVLVIDDNPLTRKVVRITLESEGYTVIEASNGKAGLEVVSSKAVDLVLQDLVLPDADGIRLVEELHALPGGRDIPVIAFSGFPSKMSQARTLEPGFTDYILKPIAPSRLAAIVRGYIVPTKAPQQPGRGRRVLVVDDDPIQLKLLKVHLKQFGFAVDTATDGLDGLEQARRRTPDAIVSDMLMPKLDGFKFCLQIRQDGRTGHIPVVLTTAAFIEDADRKLAEAAGASAFVVRTPNVKDVIEAVLESLDSASQVSGKRRAELPIREYSETITRQLDRQLKLGADTAQRLAWLEGNLSILPGIAEMMKRDTGSHLLMDDILYQCLEATGAARGAAYLIGPDARLSLRASIGFHDVETGHLSEFFGHLNLLQQVVEAGEPLELPSGLDVVSGASSSSLLDQAGATSILIAPLVSGSKRLGALVTAWSGPGAVDDSHFLARVVSAQMGQAVDLLIAVSQLGESEERYRLIVETAGEGIWTANRENRTTFVNARLARMLGYTVDEMLGRPFSDFIDEKDWKFEVPAPRTSQSGNVLQYECKFLRKDGTELCAIVCASFIFEEGEYAGTLGMVTDISDRKRAEEAREQLLAEVNLRAAEAAAANKELEAFSYSVSHDLRAPLRHLDGFSKALLEDYQDKLDQRGQEYLHFIRNASQTMGSLIDDLLRLSRVTQSELSREDVDLSGLAGSIVASLRKEHPERNVEVAVDTGIFAKGDPVLVRVALQNLIENAWKFTSGREDALIEFGRARFDGEEAYYVRDNGAGFDMTYSHKLFGAFQRLHRAEEFAGTGIGLATVQRIIHRHGGRIWADATVDQGATFYFTLPDSTAHARKASMA